MSTVGLTHICSYPYHCVYTSHAKTNINQKINITINLNLFSSMNFILYIQCFLLARIIAVFKYKAIKVVLSQILLVMNCQKTAFYLKYISKMKFFLPPVLLAPL